MEISPINKIGVVCYRKSIKDTGFQFCKYSKQDKFDRSKNTNEVKNRIGYVHPEDPYLNILEDDQLVRNYNYGQQTIPLLKEHEESLQNKSDKELKLLGFVLEDKIPRHLLMGSVDAVNADEGNEKDLRAFNALVKAMIVDKKLALGKFVSRQNEIPKLTVLYPKTKKNQKHPEQIVYFLYMVELPTIEDIREYNFGSSLKSTPSQQLLVSELVNEMDLTKGLNEEEQEDIELLKPSMTQNPLHDLFYQRALEIGLAAGSQTSRPIELDDNIRNIIQAEQFKRKRIKTVSSKISEIFELKENQAKPEKTEKMFWNDLMTTKQEEEKREQIKDKKDKDDEAIKDISKHHPISDFREMLRNKKEDLVEKAIHQLKALIIELIKSSNGTTSFSKALELVLVLREGCVQEDEPDLFNDFVRDIKENLCDEDNVRDFLNVLRKEEIALISKAESHQSKVSPDKAKEYIFEKAKHFYLHSEHRYYKHS